MASARVLATRLTAGLPAWLAATVEHNESFRFEALTLLAQARTRLAEIEAKPPADPSSVAVAVLHPFHLAVKGLLAAKGVKVHATRAALALLPLLYAGALPAERIESYVQVQGLKLQGAKSIEAAKAFLAAADALLNTAA